MIVSTGTPPKETSDAGDAWSRYGAGGGAWSVMQGCAARRGDQKAVVGLCARGRAARRWTGGRAGGRRESDGRHRKAAAAAAVHHSPPETTTACWSTRRKPQETYTYTHAHASTHTQNTDKRETLARNQHPSKRKHALSRARPRNTRKERTPTDSLLAMHRKHTAENDTDRFPKHADKENCTGTPNRDPKKHALGQGAGAQRAAGCGDAVGVGAYQCGFLPRELGVIRGDGCRPEVRLPGRRGRRLVF